MITNIAIPYSIVRGGARYWQLGEQRAAGSPVPAYEALGPEGFPAQRKALGYYDAWKAWKAGPEQEDKLGGYPPGSLGAFFTAWKKTEDFRVDKKPRTQDEYQYAWDKRIGPAFGHVLVTKITVSDSETFHRRMRKELSPREAWSTLKIWRALLVVMAKKDIIPKPPIGNVSNPMPPSRDQFWIEHDVQRLMRACYLAERFSKSWADKRKYVAMGLAIRMAWDSALSPPDVRTFSITMLKNDREGYYIERPRTKTQKQAQPVISRGLAEALLAYAKDAPFLALPTQPLFRHTQGKVWTHGYMAQLFGKIRKAAFGKAERRQFQDIRRSANLEAEIGGASPEDRAATMANALDKNPALDATYTPPTVAAGRKVRRAREVGRELLAQEIGRKAK